MADDKKAKSADMASVVGVKSMQPIVSRRDFFLSKIKKALTDQRLSVNSLPAFDSFGTYIANSKLREKDVNYGLEDEKFMSENKQKQANKKNTLGGITISNLFNENK